MDDVNPTCLSLHGNEVSDLTDMCIIMYKNVNKMQGLLENGNKNAIVCPSNNVLCMYFDIKCTCTTVLYLY